VYRFFVIGRMCADAMGEEASKAENDTSGSIAMFSES
jgi:hypothetical protein